METIAERIKQTKGSLPEGTRLVAVSKFHPAEAIKEAYDCGQRIFGESKVQELTAKHESLPKDIEWHFIGHLQTNKVKYIVPFVTLIQSVDSIKLAKEINNQAKKNGRTIDCLLEVHVAQEETKYGFSPNEVVDLFASGTLKEFGNLNIIGIMGMASNTDNQQKIREEFSTLHNTFSEIKKKFAPQFRELSMGMSGDYKIAVEEGSTLVRVGSYIFGERNY